MLGNIKVIKSEFNYGLVESEGKVYWMSLVNANQNLKVGDAVTFDKVENGRFEQAINVIKK